MEFILGFLVLMVIGFCVLRYYEHKDKLKKKAALKRKMATYKKEINKHG